MAKRIKLASTNLTPRSFRLVSKTGRSYCAGEGLATACTLSLFCWRARDQAWNTKIDVIALYWVCKPEPVTPINAPPWHFVYAVRSWYIHSYTCLAAVMLIMIISLYCLPVNWMCPADCSGIVSTAMADLHYIRAHATQRAHWGARNARALLKLYGKRPTLYTNPWFTFACKHR